MLRLRPRAGADVSRPERGYGVQPAVYLLSNDKLEVAVVKTGGSMARCSTPVSSPAAILAGILCGLAPACHTGTAELWGRLMRGSSGGATLR